MAARESAYECEVSKDLLEFGNGIFLVRKKKKERKERIG